MTSSSKTLASAVAAGLATLTLAGAALADGLTLDQAVATALKRNRDVIANQLDIEASELDRAAAGVSPNPTFQYQVGNIVLGHGNTQNMGVSPGPFDQLVHTFSV